MEDLSSCYFCGTAIEAPVREYPVVPEEVGGGEGPRVSLCPTCRRKHRAVVEAVVASMEGREPEPASVDVPDDAGRDGAAGGSDSAGTGDSAEGDATARSSGEGASTDDPIPGLGDSPPDSGTDDGSGTAGDGTADAGAADAGTTDAGQPEVAADADATGSDGPAGTDAASPGGDHEGSSDEDGSGDVNGGATDEDAGTADEHTGGPDEDAGSVSEDDGAPDGPEPVFSASTPADGDEDRDADEPEPVFSDSTPVGGGAGGAETGESADEAPQDDEEDEDSGPSVDLSTPPHSKVVRQLQNREFPVDRGEIVAVATGAYGLSNDEARAALDGLVEQGILEEDDGRLFRVGDRGHGPR